MSGNTYYISQSTGNDNNSGQSVNDPWQTFGPLSEVTLGSGDQVLLKCGDIWRGHIELDVSGGSSENPIRISSYGEGAKPDLRYYRDAIAEKSEGICLVLNNPNGLLVSGLSVGRANLGIRLRYDPDHYSSEYVRFENCHFHDIYGVTQLDNMSSIYVSAGIDTEIIGSTGDFDGNWPLTGLYIDRCTTYDAGTLLLGPVGVYGLYMTDCVAVGNGYYGTTVFGCSHGYIDRCVFDGNGTRPMPAGSCGIMISAIDFTVRNTVISNQLRQGNDPDGCGIDFEQLNRDVSIENCLLTGNAGVGIMFFTSGQGEAGANYNCNVTNCMFVNNHTNPGNVFGGEIFMVDYGLIGGMIKDNLYRQMRNIKFIFIIDGKTPDEAGSSFTEQNNNWFSAITMEARNAYNAFLGFSDETLWSYQRRHIINNSYEDLILNEDGTLYIRDANYISNSWLSTGVTEPYETVLSFIAPYDGVVRISSSGDIVNHGVGFDETTFNTAYARVWDKNNQSLAYYDIPADMTPVETSDIEDVTVKRGDVIRFFVGSMSYTNLYIAWIPVVAYTQLGLPEDMFD